MAALLGIVVLTWLVTAVAPRFGGRADAHAGLKLAAYSATASWIAGVFALVPALAPLGILGLYSIYVLFIGAGPVARVPADRALPFTAVLVVAAIVVSVALGAVAGLIG